MKFIAIVALFGAIQAHKLGYEESEGPTKTDNGENDDYVTLREQDIKNGEKKSGWTNPLGWADEGDDDDSVITQLDSQINMAAEHHAKHHGRHHNKHQHHSRHPQRSFAQHHKNNQMKMRDEYDGDTNTVSPYDAMEKHEKYDWGVPRGQHGHYNPDQWEHQSFGYN